MSNTPNLANNIMDQNSFWYKVTPDPISLADVESFLFDERAGGVNVFIGVTRRWTGDKETTELVYECYEAMAEKEMMRLLIDAKKSWPLIKGCILHRTGYVTPGEPSVIIGVATPHRQASFEACKYLIDTLKVKVPIWKKESFADGTMEWVNPTGNKS